jgi:hypothetical protein
MQYGISPNAAEQTNKEGYKLSCTSRSFWNSIEIKTNEFNIETDLK